MLERDVRMLARSQMVSLGKEACRRSDQLFCIRSRCTNALTVLVAVEEVIKFQPCSLVGTLKPVSIDDKSCLAGVATGSFDLDDTEAHRSLFRQFAI